MRKFILVTFLSCGLLYQMKSNAQQLDHSITENYSPSIVAKVYKVFSKCGIDATKQNTLAALFQMQDSTINSMILANASKSSIDSISKVMNRNFISLLSPDEKNDYYKDYKYNKEGRETSFKLLSTALENKDTLQLTVSSKHRLAIIRDSLERAENDFNTAHPDQYYKAGEKENTSIHGVLNNSQYMELIAIINKSTDQTRDLSYYSQFSLAIIYKDLLELSSDQIDSLVFYRDNLKANSKDFTKQNPSKFYDSRAFQSYYLTRILNDIQYTKLLVIKNKNKAENFALNDWRELEQRSLIYNYNKDSVIQQLTEFYIKRESAFNRYEHDRVAQSAHVRIVYANKPQPLIALEHARRNPANNTINQGYNWQP